MAFRSKWMDWGKEVTAEGKMATCSSGSFDSSLDIRNDPKNGSIIKKIDYFPTPRCQNSEIPTNVYLQCTDKTAKTQILDGHKVSRIIWRTDKATIFQDEAGKFWRFLVSYGKTWPVIVRGKK